MNIELFYFPTLPPQIKIVNSRSTMTQNLSSTFPLGILNNFEPYLNQQRKEVLEIKLHNFNKRCPGVKLILDI
jgi:hypothetical protein